MGYRLVQTPSGRIAVIDTSDGLMTLPLTQADLDAMRRGDGSLDTEWVEGAAWDCQFRGDESIGYGADAPELIDLHAWA